MIGFGFRERLRYIRDFFLLSLLATSTKLPCSFFGVQNNGSTVLTPTCICVLCPHSTIQQLATRLPSGHLLQVRMPHDERCLLRGHPLVRGWSYRRRRRQQQQRRHHHSSLYQPLRRASPHTPAPHICLPLGFTPEIVPPPSSELERVVVGQRHQRVLELCRG